MRILFVQLIILFASLCGFAADINLPETLNAGILLSASTQQAEYPGSALYDYVDGDADRFMRYGFKTCITRTYKSAGGAEA